MSLNTTVVVPTYNEQGNIAPLVDRLAAAFPAAETEVLFVDDSTDDTPRTIRQVAYEHHVGGGPLLVGLIHRTGESRTGGLSGAVTTGIRAARGDVVVVMDGDLQHPPELAPRLRDAVREHGLDLAVASRYAGQGDASGLSSSWRRTVSSTSTTLARTLFPRRVGARTTDPMTGYFSLRTSAVDLGKLRPRGFKILLEILASHDLDVGEIPFVFGERHSGESKASWRNGLHFVHQLASLRATPILRFAGVGALGLLVNLLAMAALLRTGLHYVAASVIATELAIVHNFLMQERFVFASHLRHTTPRHGWRHRAWRSVLYNNIDNAVRVPLLVLLVERLGMNSVFAQALTLVIAFGARFLYTSRVVYRPSDGPGATAAAVATPMFAGDRAPFYVVLPDGRDPVNSGAAAVHPISGLEPA